MVGAGHEGVPEGIPQSPGFQVKQSPTFAFDRGSTLWMRTLRPGAEKAAREVEGGGNPLEPIPQ